VKIWIDVKLKNGEKVQHVQMGRGEASFLINQNAKIINIVMVIYPLDLY
jgi:hypothetical protein